MFLGKTLHYYIAFLYPGSRRNVLSCFMLPTWLVCRLHLYLATLQGSKRDGGGGGEGVGVLPEKLVEAEVVEVPKCSIQLKCGRAINP